MSTLNGVTRRVKSSGVTAAEAEYSNLLYDNQTRPVNRVAKLTARTSKPSRPTAKRARFATGDDHLARWCNLYILVAAAFSAGLNGWANAQHSPEGMVWAAWACGIVVPALVLMLGRIAGLLFKRGLSRLSLAIAVIASAGLFLSVWHCSVSIALWTGQGMWLAVAFSIVIDCGLVACEVASLMR